MLNNQINSPYIANSFNVRLTPTSGVPIVNDAGSPVSNIYATPCFGGDLISIWDAGASVFKKMRLTDTAIPVPATASTIFDVFAADAGAGIVSFSTEAWISTLLGRNVAVSYFHGIRVQTLDHTKTYIGTFHTDASGGTVTFNPSHRNIWNEFNRVIMPAYVIEAAAFWALGASPPNTFRQVNSNTDNAFNFVQGFNDDPIHMRATNMVNAPGSPAAYAGIGINSSTINSATINYPDQLVSNNLSVSSCEFRGFMPIPGSLPLIWLEAANVDLTFLGGNGGVWQSGMVGSFRC